jgi:serine protease Do
MILNTNRSIGIGRTPRKTSAASALLALGAVLSLPALPLLTAGAAHAQFAANTGRAPASFADIVDRVKPSVVSIFVSGGGSPRVAQNAPAQPGTPPGQRPQAPTPRGGGGSPGGSVIPGLPEDHPLNEFFKNFPRGNPGAPSPGMPSLAQGSGFVISEDGYVVTNNHVVENGDKIQISFDGQDKLEAEKIGTDPRTDIALLKIKGDKKYPFVKFASKDPRVGDWVLAVGNPFGFGGTVTAGIVSALARDVGGALNDFLQIDAAVNRGNSGGPTFNLEGEVVGVNTAIYSPSGGNVGIAFAVPSKTVSEVVAQLRASGNVSRGWLGVKIQNVDEDTAQALGLGEVKGAVINEVTLNGPAANAGLKNGDTILSVRGEKIADSRDLARKIAGVAPNAMIDVKILRGGKEQTIAVKLGDFRDAEGPRPAVAAKPDAAKPAAVAQTEVPSLGLALSAPGSTQAKGVKDGVVIANVDVGSDASTKGLRVGDVILEVSGQPVSSPQDVASGVDEAEKLGRKAVMMRVKSGDAARFVAVQIKKKG